MKTILIASILISFLSSLIFLPKWIKKCHKIRYLWEDMNKLNNPKNVAASGGIIIVLSFIFGILSYIAIRTFLISPKYEPNGVSISIFALINVVLISAIVALIDDFLGWKSGGLSIRMRILLAFLASIPLVVINAGQPEVSIPFLDSVNLGLIYPLIIIPLGVAGATTTYNFLAGFNGLESGQGIIILSFLSFIAYVTGHNWLSLIGLCMVAPLIVFYFYNKFPAKVFPGDVLTYSIGALIASMAILGDFEKIAVFVFIPYIIETFLKLRGRLKKQSFAIPNKDRSLDMPYKKIYGLTHLSLFILKKFKKKVYEKDVVYLIFAFQIFICLLSLIIFKRWLF
ncbi:glycosyl transferase family 4 [Candidatus Pacearchaeota archaeon]|nr:glycosyl transferase family 4 [Candidatus Pacearchaeota archaeon]MBD3282838.1 glycosyl transferase family 4 [Candidatus Pacearchaeota archaeon]